MPSISKNREGDQVKFTLRRDKKFSSPALAEAMVNLTKVMDAQSEGLRRVEEDILTLESWLVKCGAPIFASKAHGIAWAKSNKGRKRLVFCDDENLGPILEGSPVQKIDAYQRLPDFLLALGEHVQRLLSEEPLRSIVVAEVEVKRIGNEVP